MARRMKPAVARGVEPALGRPVGDDRRGRLVAAAAGVLGTWPAARSTASSSAAIGAEALLARVGGVPPADPVRVPVGSGGGPPLTIPPPVGGAAGRSLSV